MTNERLSPDEIAGLREVGKTLSRVLDDDIRDSLVEKGLIVQRMGGYARTEKGAMVLVKHDR